MNIQTVISKIRRIKPQTFEEINGLGLSLRYIGAGAFREVFKIGKLPLVVKVPMSVGSERSIDNYHANREMRKLNKILNNSELKPLHRYMPKVYYHDKKSGIIVMKKYDSLSYTVANESVALILHRLVVDLLHNHTNDVTIDNIGKYIRNMKTHFVIWDLGCL